MAGCTTKESIYEDNANRSVLIYIDNSVKQDERIIAYQQQVAQGTVDFKEEEKWQKLFLSIQRMIVAKPVRNPYATQLQLPSMVFKRRRTNALYLKFIEIVTIYNQHRESKKVKAILRPSTDGGQNEEQVLETTIEDIEWANKLLKQVLLRKSDDLSESARNILEAIKAHLKNNHEQEFTSNDIRQELRLSDWNIKRYFPMLTDLGYFKIVRGSRARGFVYKIANEQEYLELKSGVFYQLDKAVEKLKKVQ